MAKTRARSAASDQASAKEVRQANIIKKLKKEDKWLKRGLLAALILILLLLLWIGYATDWMNGLRKDAVVKPVSSGLDSGMSDSEDGSSGSNSEISGGTGDAGGSGGGGVNSTDSTNTTTERSTTNNTTTNNTTTNNNDGTDQAGLYGALLTVYEDAQVGDNLSEVVDQATSLGLTVECSTVMLIETCVISAGTKSITVRAVAGTGLVTSVIGDLL